MNNQPLVSCIMPTYNRRQFVPRAVEYFLRQDYEPKELIVVDDGDDAVADLMPQNEPRVRYIRLNKRLSVGAKRNVACEHAHGEVIAHWDDDDWHAPRRLSYQVGELLRAGVEVCGIHTLLFYDPQCNEAWRYAYSASQRFWLAGSTLCYKRSFWQSHRFADTNVGEDARFVWSGDVARMTALSDPTFHVGIIHAGNISPKQTHGAYWQHYPVESIKHIMKENADCLLPGSDAAKRIIIGGTYNSRGIGMFTTAHTNDLSLPEFVAFNSGQVMPRMRQWELPFALFQSQLSNTMSVLDCTINPAGFEEQLLRLYPHTLYRHHRPIQNGQFVLPVGVPDGAFSRVICVNTLEHLLKPQRDLLIAEMSRKLKPGGWLIVTTDYYFDSAWHSPAFIQAGVMREDRQEVFNGYNKVTPEELLETCGRAEMHAMSDSNAASFTPPQEGDTSLYLQQPPHPHACIGAVFVKGGEERLVSAPDGRKIVLALLTWNTCGISMDSVSAHIREARLLLRLGQAPVICICDNGSTDGTADALRNLEAQGAFEGIPYHLILNTRNCGNSIARNQIIDYALGVNADYLLFVDGDIEVVPFSSFALLRHMENNGHRLGCIGANSMGQTPNRQYASSCLFNIEASAVRNTNLVAWTQYGLFRCDLFRQGIRFDQQKPFDSAGWGFEDNDLAFQIATRGYLNQYFSGMVYLHRALHSSLRLLRDQGADPHELYARRKQYVIEKWAGVQEISAGPLMDVRRVVMPH